VLDSINVRFQLKKSYPPDEIGHFRAFVDIMLRAIKHDILMIWFGSSDKSHRFRADAEDEWKKEPTGIAHGISSGQWERQVKLPAPSHAGQEDESKTASASSERDSASSEADEDEKDKRELVQTGGGSEVGMDSVPSIVVHYSHDDPLIRFRPRLQLHDLEDCMFMPVLNRSLAEKLHSIQVFANGYKLADIGPNDFQIDDSSYKPTVPDVFTPDELADPWVRIRPANMSSTFHLRFTSTTPKRMYEHEEMRDTPAPKTV